MFAKKWGNSGPKTDKNQYTIIFNNQEGNMEIFYGIVAAVALSVVIMFFQKKNKQNSWVGIVKKIKIKEANYNSDPEYSSTNDWTSQTYIHYQMDNGKKGKFYVTTQQFNQMYPDLKVGERLIKKAGAHFPDRVLDTR